MGITSTEKLKQYFKKGAYPTEAQFANLIDSFFHKSEDGIDLTKIKGLQNSLNTIIRQIEDLNKVLFILQEWKAAIDPKVNTVVKNIADIEQSIGEPDGIAPLDGAGQVPAKYLPSYVDDVVEFDGVLTSDEGITVGGVPDEYKHHMISDLGIWYYAPLNAFCRYSRVYASHTTVGIYMDPEGEGCAAMGELVDGKVIPVAGKIYVHRAENDVYRWSGSALIKLGHSPLVIGTASGTAMDGAQGEKIRHIAEEAKAKVENLAWRLIESIDVINVNTANTHENAYKSFAEVLANLPVEYTPETYWDQTELWPLPGHSVKALVATSEGDVWQTWRFTPGDADWSEFDNVGHWTYVPEGTGGNATVDCPTCATNNIQHFDFVPLGDYNYSTLENTAADGSGTEYGAFLMEKGSVVVQTLTIARSQIKSDKRKHNHIFLPTTSDGIQEGDVVRILDARSPNATGNDSITIHGGNVWTGSSNIYGLADGRAGSFTLKCGYVELMAFKPCVGGVPDSVISWIVTKRINF